ncbi:MAG: RDD family protein [Bacteriovoracaceae bacterium]|nr:RDD family protein [Bacteriovoracaceae bacterium]
MDDDTKGKRNVDENWDFKLDSEKLEQHKREREKRELEKEASGGLKRNKFEKMELDHESLSTVRTRREQALELKEDGPEQDYSEIAPLVRRMAAWLCDLFGCVLVLIILYYGKFPHLVSRVLKIEFGFNYEVFDKSLKGILEKMLHHPTVGDILKNDIPIDVSFMFCWDFVFGAVLFVIIYLVIFVFPVIIWGKTFGKKLMRLEIVHINGGYMDSFSVIKREMIGKTILFFGIVTVFFNKRRRALHDFLFGSLVVRYDDRVFNPDKKATFR